MYIPVALRIMIEHIGNVRKEEGIWRKLLRRLSAKGLNRNYTTNFENEFISLRILQNIEMGDPRFVIQNWMRNRNTIEFLGVWEELHNPDFNRVHSRRLKMRLD